MKKTIVIASLFAASLAFAGATEITNEYVIGVLPITFTNRSEIIVSIPWVAEGGAVTTGIAVSNLVKTAGLTAGASEDDDGDKLSWYDIDDGKFQTWRLVANGTTNYWKATKDASGPLPKYATMEPVLKRGEAAILTTSVKTNTIYVVGQLGSTAAVTNTIAAAKYDDKDKLTPSHTLVAPPRALVSYFDLNSLSYVSGSPDETRHTSGNISHVGDMIITEALEGLTLAYVYVDINGNKKWTPTYNLGSGVARVPAGRGFWYQRATNTELKITWDAPVAGN